MLLTLGEEDGKFDDCYVQSFKYPLVLRTNFTSTYQLPNMAPKKEKQTPRPVTSTADDIVPDKTQPANERVPTEVLQMIFEYLDFYDLIRCIQVCQRWAKCLPGDESKLRNALFSQDGQSACTARSLRLNIHFDIKGYLVRLSGNLLPYICWALREKEIKFDTGGSTCVNPIISRQKQLYHIVHSGHELHKNISLYRYKFKKLEDLRSITSYLGNITDCGNWKDMLVCVPAVTKLEVVLSVGGVGTHCPPRTIEDSRGVRMQSLVALIRVFLQELVDVVKADAPKAQIVDHGYKPR